MITVYPIGTTIYKPRRCYNGYTVMCFPAGPSSAGAKAVKLVDMNGNIVNQWNVRAIRAKLLKNGNLLVVERRKERNRVREYSWNRNLVWDYEPPGNPHHDLQRLNNGNTLLIYREEVPEESLRKVKDPERRKTIIHSDSLLEVTPEREVVWEWHGYEHIDINWYNPLCIGDWMHTNTVQALPKNRHYDAGDERFKPGNVMISPRSLDTILIIDKDSKEIVWKYVGHYMGGLQGQHEPYMIEKGLPGAGNILVFDNGSSTLPLKSLRHPGESYVLEIDPSSERIVWKYENGEKFFSKFRSNVQRLPNGNTLICESEGHRIFEVTPRREIVWEYAVPWHHLIGRAYRYSYDYCPQLRALRKPKEDPVIPPSHVRTHPLKPKVRREDMLWDFRHVLKQLTKRVRR